MTNTAPTHDLQSEVRQMWRTRPVRTPDDRKIAGVCGGIGRRYGVDPILVRILFVVAAIWGGAGVALYALAWLTFRSPGDEVSMGESLIGRGRSSGSKALAVVLVLVAIAAAPSFGGSGETLFVGTGLLMVLAMLAGWYGLHRRTPEPSSAWTTMAATPYRPEAPVGTGGARWSNAPAPGHEAPPAWDPLGAAPFAWDLPEPGKAPAPRPPRERPRLTWITLGLATIATAVAVGLAHFGHVAWLTPARIGAIALAVIGAGLLVGSFTRRGHGLLVFAGPLAGFVALASLVSPGDVDQHFGPGSRAARDVVITSPEQIEDIRTGKGAVRVDMSSLELDRDRSMHVNTDLGAIDITLPPDTDVRVECTSDLGPVECPSGLDVGPDGPGGPVLRLDVDTDLGAVKVSR